VEVDVRIVSRGSNLQRSR